MFVPDSTKKRNRSGRLALAGVAGLILSLLMLVVMAREADSTVPGPAPEPAGQAGSEGPDSGTAAEARRRILVRFEPGTVGEERIEAREAVDAEFVDSYSLVPRLQLIEIPEGEDRSEAIAELNDRPEVTYAEPDLIRTVTATSPNDTFFRSPNFYHWGLNNTGQTFRIGATNYTGTPDADIDAPEAWDLSRGSPEVTVAVVDTGIQLNHPDLAANLWTNPNEIPGNGIDDDGNGRIDDVHGWDFVNNDNDPSDDRGHGTHVAGTVGAVGNNNVGVTGVAWNVKLMPLKACGADGRCPTSATIAALNYAVARGVKISNHSYGGIGSVNTSERNAITNARTAGHLFVAAAGNDGENTDSPGKSHYPSNYTLDNIVSVASTTLNDGLSSFSNWGSTSVDLGAPGSQIVSTYTGSSYLWLDGTSMAAPHVAGVAALIRSRKPGWSYSQVRARMLDNTRPLTALSGRTVTGGMLNAFAALDFAPDAPSITAGPSGATDSDAATFSFTGETVGAGTTFECRIDAGAWEACSSPKSYTGLFGGVRVFEVRQTDSAGNTSEAASRTWTVNTELEPPLVLSGPSGFTSSRAATFEFTGVETATFECRIDGAAWEPCSSPKSYTELAEGSRTFEVRQRDSMDRISEPVSRSWTVDTVAPSAPTISSGPSGFVSSTSASFSFTGEASATFECRLDSGSWESCSSPKSYTSLSQGSHTFEVRQTDQAGNTSTEASRTWTVDTIAPSAPTISSGPSGFVSSTTASFGFTGEAEASFECRIDSGSWGSCSSPRAYSGLSQGSHTFEVRQSDQAGNTSTEASRTWTVDTIAPSAPTISSGPSGFVSSTSASFSFTGEASATFECRLDSGAWEACESPKTYTELPQGDRNFEVRQTDRAGNVSTAGSRSWTVDTVAPDAPSITSGPSGLSGSAEATFTFTGEEGASFECSRDGSPWASCLSPKTISSLSEGPHTFRVRQLDRAGNTSPATVRDWEVVLTVGQPEITSGPEGKVNSTSAEFGFTGQEGATFACRIDDGPLTPCESPFRVTGLTAGNHEFAVQQTDTVGNTSLEAVRSWIVLEVATVEPGVAGTSEIGEIVLEGAPEGFSYLCSINGGDLEPCDSPFVPVGLTDGKYVLQVVITDGEGNRSELLETEVEIEGAPEPPTGNASVSINGGARWAISPRVALDLDWPRGARTAIVSNPASPGSESKQLTPKTAWTLASGQGERSVSVQFLGAGNTPLATVSSSIFLDPNRPSLGSARVSKRRGKSWWVTVRASDSGSGLAQVAFSTRKMRPGTATKPTQVSGFTRSSTVKTKLSAAPRWFKVRDRAGNWSGWRAVRQR